MQTPTYNTHALPRLAPGIIIWCTICLLVVAAATTMADPASFEVSHGGGGDPSTLTSTLTSALTSSSLSPDNERQQQHHNQVALPTATPQIIKDIFAATAVAADPVIAKALLDLLTLRASANRAAASARDDGEPANYKALFKQIALSLDKFKQLRQCIQEDRKIAYLCRKIRYVLLASF